MKFGELKPKKLSMYNYLYSILVKLPRVHSVSVSNDDFGYCKVDNALQANLIIDTFDKTSHFLTLQFWVTCDWNIWFRKIILINHCLFAPDSTLIPFANMCIHSKKHKIFELELKMEYLKGSTFDNSKSHYKIHEGKKRWQVIFEI